MLTLRPQQHTAKLLLYDSFNQGNESVLICAPTGFGKTVLFSDIAREMLENGVPTMIMCDRVELLSQAEEKLNKNGLYPVVIDPDYIHKISNLYLASVDTLRNRKFPEVQFIIIDECHKRTFDEIALHYLPIGVKIAGFTATPVRTGKSSIDGNEKYTGQLIDVYQDLIIASTIGEQLEAGYLLPAIHTSVEMDVSDVKITNTKEGLEYNQKDVFKKFDKPVMYDGVIENYKKFANGKRVLVFNVDVAHSKKMTAAFLAVGIPSAHVDGKTPKRERKKIFKDFKEGKILTLNNCGVATTGYDEPRAEGTIINRLILSLSLYLQIIGRSGRPCPEIGKTHHMIIDQGANYIKHGYFDTEREWYLDPIKQSRQSTGVAPMVHCEKCECFISASARKCPFCEIEQERPEPAHNEPVMGEFKILDSKQVKKPVSKMNIEELEEYCSSKKYHKGWVVRQLFLRGEAALIEYANYKNYAKAWVTKQIEMASNIKDNALSNVWEFIKANPHLSEDQIKDFASKKLKVAFESEQITELIPDILQAGRDYKNGVIDENGNSLKKV